MITADILSWWTSELMCKFPLVMKIHTLREEDTFSFFFKKLSDLQMRGRFRNRLLFDINTPSKLQRSEGTGEEEAMTFATKLDHRGILNSECQQSSPRCQGVRERLRGHWPLPHDHGDARSPNHYAPLLVARTHLRCYRETFLFCFLFSKDPLGL